MQLGLLVERVNTAFTTHMHVHLLMVTLEYLVLVTSTHILVLWTTVHLCN